MQDREYIRQQLKDGVVGTIFHTTTDSLFGRLSPTGYLPESLTGMYDGEYCRTIGAFVPLCLEMGRAKEARKALEFIFLSMERLGLEKIPHVLGLSADGNPYCISEEDQIDGRAHVVLAFAQYCLTTGDTSFADRYYDLACRETRTFFNQPYLYYQPLRQHWPSTGLRIVLNASFEHSREQRRWSVFDLLTQVFVGAAGSAVKRLTLQRDDLELARWLEERLEILRAGVQKYMTHMVGDERVYLEMRLPDGGWGKPYPGMSWVNLAPIAAGWDGMNEDIFLSTMKILHQKLTICDPYGSGSRVTVIETDGNNAPQPVLMGKMVGWDIEFCRQQRDWKRIRDWMEFLNTHHTQSMVLMEAMRFTAEGWQLVDCGNGEQCCWWCWAMNRLNQALCDQETPRLA